MIGRRRKCLIHHPAEPRWGKDVLWICPDCRPEASELWAILRAKQLLGGLEEDAEEWALKLLGVVLGKDQE